MKVEDDHTHIAITQTSTLKSFVSINKHLLRGNASVTTGLSTSLSMRHAHTDSQVPNFDYFRRQARLDSSKSYRDADDATSP